MTQGRVRIGAVRYLNSKPLVYRLEEFAPDAEIVYDVPSRLADGLRSGRLEVGLIPSIEYFRGEGYTIVPGLAVASDGPVDSVKLFSRKPLSDIESLALDEGSRTSQALVQILLGECYDVRPRVEPFGLDRAAWDTSADAVLLIGDRTMKAASPEFPVVLDLGAEWKRWTGLPFVYAFWAVREGVDLAGVERALKKAKEAGCREAVRIAAEEGPRLGLAVEQCEVYLRERIRFDLGPREFEGLERFYALAVENGFAPEGVPIVFYGRANLAKSR